MNTNSTGVGVRITNQAEWIWRQGGVAATDAAALVNCSAQSDQTVFVLLAQKVQMRELPAIREELKREAAVRKQQNLAQDTPEWHAQRLTGIGATEAVGLVGAAWSDSKNKCNAIKQTYLEKTGQVEVKKYENPNMARGKALEPVARRKYESLVDWSVEPLCVLHDSFDFVRASLDGLRADDGLVVEIKCPGLPNHRKFRSIAEIEDPLERQHQFSCDFNYYRAQCLWQLMITGSPRVHFVSYNEEEVGFENQLVMLELYPEPDMQELLLQRAVEFWGFVESRTFPPTEWLRPCHFPPTNVLVP